jgi:hypothetical protein
VVDVPSLLQASENMSFQTSEASLERHLGVMELIPVNEEPDEDVVSAAGG